MNAGESSVAGSMIRVATYNIHRAIGADGQRRPARIVAVLREIDADIVALQEVDWHGGGGADASQSEMLADLPGFAAVLGPNLRDHRGHYGNMLLTRLPIAARRRIDLAEPQTEPRGAIDATITAPGGRLRVIATHLGLGLGERRRQARKLVAALAHEPDCPTVVMGDFNEWLPLMPSLAPVTRLCARSPLRRSYPARRPLLALDRIFMRGAARLEVDCHRSPLARVASDHLPVVGRLYL